jgi:hypothetical protein
MLFLFAVAGGAAQAQGHGRENKSHDQERDAQD